MLHITEAFEHYKRTYTESKDLSLRKSIKLRFKREFLDY